MFFFIQILNKRVFQYGNVWKALLTFCLFSNLNEMQLYLRRTSIYILQQISGFSLITLQLQHTGLDYVLCILTWRNGIPEFVWQIKSPSINKLQYGWIHYIFGWTELPRSSHIWIFFQKLQEFPQNFQKLPTSWAPWYATDTKTLL